MWLGLKVTIAVAVALAIYLVGVWLVRMFLAVPPPEDEREAPEPVNIRFECLICGTEVTVTAAPGGELPSPPRHCMEEMHLVG